MLTGEWKTNRTNGICGMYICPQLELVLWTDSSHGSTRSCLGDSGIKKMSRHGTLDRCETTCSYKLYLSKTRLRQELNIA